jgi:hypothetical protein
VGIFTERDVPWALMESPNADLARLSERQFASEPVDGTGVAMISARDGCERGESNPHALAGTGS